MTNRPLASVFLRSWYDRSASSGDSARARSNLHVDDGVLAAERISNLAGASDEVPRRPTGKSAREAAGCPSHDERHIFRRKSMDYKNLLDHLQCVCKPMIMF